jgi:hypothetical protein
MGLDKPAFPGDEKEYEKQHGQRDTHGQRVNHSLRLPVILNEVEQPGAKTRNNGCESHYDEQFNHVSAGALS